MLPPEPYTYRCRVCHWQKTLAPKSDALMPGEYFTRCPKCSSEDLEKVQASGVERALAKLKRQLTKPGW